MSWREEPERPRERSPAVMRGFLAVAAAAVPTAWLLPWLAAAGLGFAWGGHPLSLVAGGPAIAGTLAALAAWLLLLASYLPMTSVGLAQPGSYAALLNRQGGLEARLDRLTRLHRPDSPEAAACAEARSHLRGVRSYLASGWGPQWALGHGYMAAWACVHRAEEALIGAYDRTELAMQAEHDDLRLRGANLAHRKRLRKMLRQAQSGLERSCWPPPDRDRLTEVRDILREVRFAINESRDTNHYGLLRLRNQTLAVLFLTELASFGLLATAILVEVPRPSVVAGMTYFLVGATVGLFSRLHQQSQSDSAVEDYGLTLARTCTLPIYSGLAAVGGVVVQGLTRSSLDLGHVFNLATNPGGIVVGAAFAVAPALLFRALGGEQSQKYRETIRSTEASGTS
jgi:hypothetical protein